MIICHQILILSFWRNWERGIIIVFRIKFGNEVSEVDILSKVVLEELISRFLERSLNPIGIYTVSTLD